MAKYLLNAFSISMVPDGALLEIDPITEVHAKQFAVSGVPSVYLDCISAIGHANTAAVISGMLGADVPVNRINVKLIPGHDAAIVAQYSGPRLPEGAKTLPDGAKIEWFSVRVRPVNSLQTLQQRIQQLKYILVDVLEKEDVDGL